MILNETIDMKSFPFIYNLVYFVYIFWLVLIFFGGFENEICNNFTNISFDSVFFAKFIYFLYHFTYRFSLWTLLIHSNAAIRQA